MKRNLTSTLKQTRTGAIPEQWDTKVLRVASMWFSSNIWKQPRYSASRRLQCQKTELSYHWPKYHSMSQLSNGFVTDWQITDMFNDSLAKIFSSLLSKTPTSQVSLLFKLALVISPEADPPYHFHCDKMLQQCPEFIIPHLLSMSHLSMTQNYRHMKIGTLKIFSTMPKFVKFNIRDSDDI